MAEREIAGWITAFGNHIPIYTDDPNIESYKAMWKEDEDRKQKQINESKIQAETKKLQANDYKGTYHLYRAGDLSGGPSGMVYFTPDEKKANDYSKASSFTMQGKSYKRPKREVNEYDIEVKNPLVCNTIASATQEAMTAYKLLHPERAKQMNGTHEDFALIAKWAKEDGYKITGLNSRQIYLDSANAKALKNSEYDAIVYTDASKDGRVLEVITLPGHHSLRKKSR